MSENGEDSGSGGSPNEPEPVREWVLHDAWMAVWSQLKSEAPDKLARFKRAFGYTGTGREDRKICTDLLPVSASETPYRPPVMCDEHLDEELLEFARLIALLLEREIEQRL